MPHALPRTRAPRTRLRDSQEAVAEEKEAKEEELRRDPLREENNETIREHDGKHCEGPHEPTNPEETPCLLAMFGETHAPGKDDGVGDEYSNLLLFFGRHR